jgi:D-methionine transport system substrate-binding protein
MAEDQIKMGVTASPHAEIMEQVKKLLEKDGVQMKVIEFTDYIQPNAALSAGDLDANSYQHQPYLDAQIKDRLQVRQRGQHHHLPDGRVLQEDQVAQRPQGARARACPTTPPTVAAPAGAASQGRDQAQGRCRPEGNPAGHRREPQEDQDRRTGCRPLPRSLDDFDAAVINGNYAESAGLSPTKDAIAVEASTGPYANVIAVHIRADKDKPSPGSPSWSRPTTARK